MHACMHVCVLSHFSCVWLCDPMDYIAWQAPLSMGSSRQEYWSGLPFPSPTDLPNPGVEPGSPALWEYSLPNEIWWEPIYVSGSLYKLKPLAVWIAANCGKFLKRWEYQITWPASQEICMQVKKQQLELDVEKQTVPIGKGVCQGCILSPCLFNLESTSWKMPSWIKHKLESRLPGERAITSAITCRWHHPYGRKQRTKEPLDESERGEWKSCLKT